MQQLERFKETIDYVTVLVLSRAVKMARWTFQKRKKHYTFRTIGPTKCECKKVYPYSDMPDGEEIEREAAIRVSSRKNMLFKGFMEFAEEESLSRKEVLKIWK